MKLGQKKIALMVVVMMLVGTLGFVDIQAAPITKAPFSKGVVVATLLNVRQGPSTQNKIVCTLKRGDTVIVHAQTGDWYIVSCPDGHVGASLAQYIKKFGTILPPISTANPTAKPIVKPTSKPASKPPIKSTPKPAIKPPANTNAGVTLSANEKLLIDKINAERAKVGLAALIPDAKLMKVGRLKAQDMVNKNYFSHQSPTYGSPFNMMKQFGVTYKSAGENIAGNNSITNAVAAWMNSPGHKANILSKNFNYTGVGVVASNVYGKILVQEFIQK